MNDLLAKIPLEGWKSLAGALVCIAAGIGLTTKICDLNTAAGIFAIGTGMLGIGLKSASARIEQKVELGTAIAAQGTAQATVAAIKAAPDVAVATITPAAVQAEPPILRGGS